MAIIYQNPLRHVRNPETIQMWVSVAKDTDKPYAERRAAIGNLRGAATFYRGNPKYRAAIVWLRQQIVECNALLNEQGGHDVRK